MCDISKTSSTEDRTVYLTFLALTLGGVAGQEVGGMRVYVSFENIYAQTCLYPCV